VGTDLGAKRELGVILQIQSGFTGVTPSVDDHAINFKDTGAARSPGGMVRRWMVRPIARQITQGISPHKAAQATAFGFTLGIFPIIGATTLLTILVGIPLKLNQPILQAFKTLAVPLQWALILGFYRLGEWLFQVPPVSLSIPTMVSEFSEAPRAFFLKYGMTALQGVAVWCLAAPVLIALIHCTSKPLIVKMARQASRKLPTPSL
jgi:hypothetical protein